MNSKKDFLKSKTVQELKTLAKSHNIHIHGKKDEIINIIHKRLSKKQCIETMYGGGNPDLTIIKELFVNFKDLKIDKIDINLSNNIFAKLKNEIPQCCTDNTTYYNILSLLSKQFTKPIFIVGGAVRDVITSRNTENMNDIDINYTIGNTEAKKILIDMKTINEFHSDERGYIRVGPKSRNDYLEGFYINSTTYNDYSLECPMNSLMIYVKENDLYLIDLFGGKALDDVRNRIWQSPTNDYDKWLTHQKKLIWRMLKFRLRGYTVPLDTKKNVYNYWISKQNDIDIYYWQNIWWTLNPSEIQQVFKIVFDDCEELQINPRTFVEILINNELLIPNKIY